MTWQAGDAQHVFIPHHHSWGELGRAGLGLCVLGRAGTPWPGSLLFPALDGDQGGTDRRDVGLSAARFGSVSCYLEGGSLKVMGNGVRNMQDTGDTPPV